MSAKLKELKEQLDDYSLGKSAQGFVRLFSFDPATNLVKKVIESKNLVLYSGADIMARLLGGQSSYAVNTMYLEFKNLPLPTDPIVNPSFTREDGIDYYNGLISSLDTDFLRVPLVVNPNITSSGVLYEGNQATFFGISEGSVGFHGKTFGPSVNSAVYGAALIAAPDPLSQSEDLVFSRYYAGSPGWTDKILAEAGFQIGVTWTIRFS
jgi:hypothetical protein